MQMRPQLKVSQKVSQPEPSFIDRKIRGGKDVVDRARNLAPIGLMAIALLGAGSVANAGQWKLTSLTTDGKSTWPVQGDYNYNDSAYGYSIYGEHPWTSYINSDQASGNVQYWADFVTTTKPGVTLRKKEVGGGKATFTWDDSDGSQPDPYLYVKVTSEASAEANAYVSSEGGANPVDSVSLTVSNGYEAAEIVKSLSEDGQTRFANASVATSRLLRFASNGASPITVVLPVANVVATAESLALPFVWYYYTYAMTGYRPTNATVGTRAITKVARDYRGVYITSDIETSYKKVTDAAALPRMRDENDALVIDSDKIGSQTPYNGSASGPWAVECEREPGGALTVESAAVWQESSPQLQSFGVAEGWRGYVRLEAQATGFSQPQYAWDLPATMTHRKEDNDRVINAQGVQNLVGNALTDLSEHLGDETENWDSQGKSSAIGVRVFESGLPQSDTAPNSYSINWHKPVENRDVYNTSQTWTEDWLAPKPTTLLGGTTPAYVGPNDTAEAIVHPYGAMIKLGAEAYTLSYIAGFAGANLIYVATTMPPNLKAALYVMGFTASLAVQVPPPQNVTLKNTYSEWTKAVNDTQTTGMPYVYPPELASSVTLTPNAEQNDTVWQSCGMRIVRRQYWNDELFRYDGYAQHGYLGLLPGSSSIPGIHQDRGEYMQDVQQVDP